MPYRVSEEIKSDPVKRWNLSERVFFACGACHILAYAFLERFRDYGWQAVWIRPDEGYSGNHVYVTDGEEVFDWHGYSRKDVLLEHYFWRHRQTYPGWSASLVLLDNVILTSRESCLSIGMNIRGADQFLHDPLPRARKFLDRFKQQHERLRKRRND